ncbi:hypothetical protein AVEN_266014-1 [Araneus ventricosus]|uniref:Uncharacterized protein n=1 Tax=Araneus ventricosus TaxID=182803 RepID=A0A4Y2TPW7_ARAVE|nr:hypothetical protein AVEN_266014-1 [Araneus ventricosus]
MHQLDCAHASAFSAGVRFLEGRINFAIIFYNEVFSHHHVVITVDQDSMAQWSTNKWDTLDLWYILLYLHKSNVYVNDSKGLVYSDRETDNLVN